jgi:hypothetical protein
MTKTWAQLSRMCWEFGGARSPISGAVQLNGHPSKTAIRDPLDTNSSQGGRCVAARNPSLPGFRCRLGPVPRTAVRLYLDKSIVRTTIWAGRDPLGMNSSYEGRCGALWLVASRRCLHRPDPAARLQHAVPCLQSPARSSTALLARMEVRRVCLSAVLSTRAVGGGVACLDRNWRQTGRGRVVGAGRPRVAVQRSHPQSIVLSYFDYLGNYRD